MGTKIEKMICDNDGETMLLRDEFGESMECKVIASDQGITIANVDRPEKWAAIMILDLGDGEATYEESGEGDTFGVAWEGQYVVRRTDNAGSLKWAEND